MEKISRCAVMGECILKFLAHNTIIIARIFQIQERALRVYDVHTRTFN